MTENQAYTPGAEHPVSNPGMDGPLPLPRKGESEAAWMDKQSGLIFVHDAAQAAVFETPKTEGVVTRSPMYGMDEYVGRY